MEYRLKPKDSSIILKKQKLVNGIKKGVVKVLQLPESYDFIQDCLERSSKLSKGIFASFFEKNSSFGFQKVLDYIGYFHKTLDFQYFLNKSKSQNARSNILGMYSKFEAQLSHKSYERLLIMLISNTDTINKILFLLEHIVSENGEIDLNLFLANPIEDQDHKSILSNTNRKLTKSLNENIDKLLNYIELLNTNLNKFFIDFKQHYNGLEIKDGLLDDGTLVSKLYSNIFDIQFGLRKLYSKLSNKTLEQEKLFTQQELEVMAYLLMLGKQEIEVPALIKLTSADGKGATMLTILPVSFD